MSFNANIPPIGNPVSYTQAQTEETTKTAAQPQNNNAASTAPQSPDKPIYEKVNGTTTFAAILPPTYKNGLLFSMLGAKKA